MNRQQRRAATKQAGYAAPAKPQDIATLLADALTHHQAGQLTEADRLYKKILAFQPQHADSLHLLGVIAIQRQRYDSAVHLIGAAVTIDPTAPAYHSNLGTALHAAGRLAEASESFHRALTLKPDYPEAHNNLGLTLKDQGRFGEAADCYRAAIAHKADYANAYDNLGLALLEQGLPGEAVECHRMAIALKPDFPGACNNLGNALRVRKQLDEAVASYRQALVLDPKYTDAHFNLGLALHNQGRFEDAFAAHVTALRLGADPYRSYYELSHCRKFTGADRPMIAKMTALLEDRKSARADRALLHFALGKIFDDLANYRAAIRHFDDANRLEDRQFDRSGFTALIDRMIAGFPKDLPALPDTSESQLPIFIVGLPRSGTTLNEQILASHPQVGTAGEVDFWLQRLGNLDEEIAPDNYLELLAGIAPDVPRVVDKMPYNFLALGFLHRRFPNARIVHCRRNPADTALSIYSTRFSASAGVAWMNGFAYKRSDIVFYHREYSRMMAHWRAVLPANRFVEIDYERLVVDPETTARNLVAFCGLEWDAACLDFHRTERTIETASAWQARQPIYRTSANRWRHYEPWLGEFRELLPPTID